MRTVQLASAATVTVAVLVTSSGIAAQGESSGILNKVEVQQLVTRAEPADHARLSGHFAALADRYSAEATRHESMARSFVGNPRVSFGSSMSVHCKQLAGLNTESASTARDLAAYHSKLAGGMPASRPADASQFEAGKGAPEPTGNELNALAAKANTRTEHRALMEYFSTLVKRYTSEASNHVALAQAYRGTRLATAAVHHDMLARLARDAARQATAAAAMHKDLAAVR